MEYASEVIERIRGTKKAVTPEQIGRELAAQWLSSDAMYEQIVSIAVHYSRPMEVTNWIACNMPQPRPALLYVAFNEEVRRFWDQYKDVL